MWATSAPTSTPTDARDGGLIIATKLSRLMAGLIPDAQTRIYPTQRTAS